MKSHYYNVDINWENNRKGIMCSPELNSKNGICIEVATHQNSQKEWKVFGHRNICLWQL